MKCTETPTVAAYLLGALPDDERVAFAEHLAGCPTCAAELVELQGPVAVLSRLSPEDVAVDELTGEVAPSGQLLDRVLAAGRAESSGPRPAVVRHRRRRWLASAAAAAVIAAGGTTAGLLATGGHGASLPTFAARQAGVWMQVSLHNQQSGTELSVAVKGLPKGEHCQLEAVSRSGSHEIAGSWTAAYDGDASATGFTSFATNQLASLVLLGTTGHPLVTVTT